MLFSFFSHCSDYDRSLWTKAQISLSESSNSSQAVTREDVCVTQLGIKRFGWSCLEEHASSTRYTVPKQLMSNRMSSYPTKYLFQEKQNVLPICKCFYKACNPSRPDFKGWNFKLDLFDLMGLRLPRQHMSSAVDLLHV